MQENGSKTIRLKKNPNEVKPMPCDIQGTFGLNLRKARIKQGFSQEMLAEKAGCSVDTVKRYENGCSGMQVITAWYLAKALQVPIETLIPVSQDYTADQLLAKAEELIHLARQMKEMK